MNWEPNPMMQVEQKPWGKCTHLFQSHDSQIDLCDIEAGGYSSIHLHNAKHNRFIVTSGFLAVDVFDENNKLADTFLLRAGMEWNIPAGMRHQFRALSETRLVEVYTRAGAEPVSLGDIHRFSENGVKVQERQCEGGV